jgi:AbrB family looped-hinge helix DNA binding protein
MGIKMGELIIDERGRIVIPKEIRERLDLKPNQKLTIHLREREIILKPTVNSERFIAELKGCISGSRIKPLELKEIWGIKHAHH